MPNTATIRDLNDRMRNGDVSVPGQILFTSGLTDLLVEHEKSPMDVIEIVRDYDDFSEDNDPNKERDFGSFELCDTKIFWKFDYYDPSMSFGSEDPSDPTKTHRVLTVFLASEY